MAKRKRLPVSNWMAPDVDAWESAYLPPIIDELKSDLAAWQTADLRTKESLWHLLGGIYEHSAKIERDKHALMALIAMVNQIDGVRESNRWHAHTKAPQELLIVLLLGFGEDNKSTRSQWRSALNAAKKTKIKKDRPTFVNWISEIGGVEGARQSVAKPRKAISIEQLAAGVEPFVDAEVFPIKLPNNLTEDPLPERFGLILVREAGSEKTAFPIATITNEPLVRAALRTFIAEQERIEKENLAIAAAHYFPLEQIVRKMEKEARAQWKKDKKSKRTADTLEEYTDNWLVERADEYVEPGLMAELAQVAAARRAHRKV